MIDLTDSIQSLSGRAWSAGTYYTIPAIRRVVQTGARLSTHFVDESKSSIRVGSSMSEAQDKQLPFERFDESNSKSYDGSCHCGKVKFTVAISPPIEEGVVMNCNCSICVMNGYLNVYAPESKMSFHPDQTTALNNLTEYGFGAGRVNHYFCKTCGSSVCGRPTEKGREVIGNIWIINARSIKDLDLEKVKKQANDGKSW